MHDITEEPSIWSLALRDILLVMPSRRTRHLLPVMSSSQLRRKAVLAVQHENFWNAGVIRLVEAPRHYPLVALVLQVQIIPGGDLILILCSDGNMHLHRWRDVSAVPLVTETFRF